MKGSSDEEHPEDYMFDEDDFYEALQEMNEEKRLIEEYYNEGVLTEEERKKLTGVELDFQKFLFFLLKKESDVKIKFLFG